MDSNDLGRSPDGSGHSAEPEPCSTVSAETASVPNAARCEFCEAPATCMVSDVHDVFDCCPRCWAAWQRDPGFEFEFGRDKANALIALTEAVGLYIYHNNGPKVLPLKRAWNAAFPYAKASAIEAATAGETENTGSTEGESAVAKPDAQGPSQ